MGESIEYSIGIIQDILLEIQSKSVNFDNLIANMTLSSSLKPSMVEPLVRLARRFGFIEERGDGTLHLSKTGMEFVKHVNSLMANETTPVETPPIQDETRIIITVPHFYLPIPLPIKNKIFFTSEAMKQVVIDSQKILYIVSPILDIPLLQSLFENVGRKPNATVKIITSEDDLVRYQNSPKGNFILAEVGNLIKSRFRSGKIFFVKKDMSISHAKIFCSERSLLVTSANVKKNSISENFELGIHTERIDLINTTIEILDFITDDEETKCIFDTSK